jgi:hypothetical protein
MMPGSLFGLPLFLRICLKNGVTGALLTCAILLRHIRHGALGDRCDAMAKGVGEARVSGCPAIKSNWRTAEEVNCKARPQIFPRRADVPTARVGRIGWLAEGSTPELNP